MVTLDLANDSGGTVHSADIANNWWDARVERSFFVSVYRQGDRSVEGHLLSLPLTLIGRTTRECNLIEQLGKPHKGSAILDCPCGMGRHSLELASRGFRVVGVDLDPRVIVQATDDAMTRRLDSATFVAGDMRGLPLPDASVDLVVNMFLSFGFFDNDRENAEVIREWWRVLKPGGRLLIHTDVNPSRVYSDSYGDRNERTLEFGGRLFIREEFDAAHHRLRGVWRVVHDGGTSDEAGYSVRIYSDAELERMCRSAGFSRTCRWNVSARGVTDDCLAEEVVYVAWKEDGTR